MVEHMFDTVLDPSSRTLEEWDAEDRLVRELMEAGLDLEPPPRSLGLPDDLESWPADVRLAIFLSSIDVNLLSGSDRVRFLQAQHRLNAVGQARALEAVTAICDAYDQLPEDVEDPEAGASMEIRAALRWTRRATESEMELAHGLRVRLPALFERFQHGLIDRARAVVFTRHTSHLPVGHARQVVASLLDDAPRLTTGQLVERIRRACFDIDPDAAAERYEASRSQRRVTSWSDPDGTVSITGEGLDPTRVAAAKERIDRLARRLRTAGETRSMDQLRADIFIDLLTGDADLPRAGSVHLTADLATLARLADHSGDLAGYGPVIADIARQVTDQLGDGAWERTITHPGTGMPIADGTTRRRPSASQTRRIRSASRTCVAPGCRMPATDCDIDHTLAWADTGITDTRQLAALCRHDHRIRHRSGWSYRRLSNGDYQWTSPLGGTATTSGHDPP